MGACFLVAELVLKKSIVWERTSVGLGMSTGPDEAPGTWFSSMEGVTSTSSLLAIGGGIGSGIIDVQGDLKKAFVFSRFSRGSKSCAGDNKGDGNGDNSGRISANVGVVGRYGCAAANSKLGGEWPRRTDDLGFVGNPSHRLL